MRLAITPHLAPLRSGVGLFLAVLSGLGRRGTPRAARARPGGSPRRSVRSIVGGVQPHPVRYQRAEVNAFSGG